MTEQTSPDTKVMVLAAGLGTRLRPLTDVIAKPALPFFGATALDLWLSKFANLAYPVAINSHHLPEQIAAISEHASLQQKPNVIFEPQILGTGGALRNIDSWRGTSTVLICNADVISAIDIEQLIARHTRDGNAATLCLLRQHRSGTTPVFASDRDVVGIGKVERPGVSRTTEHTYACAMLLSSALIDKIPPKQSVDVWPAIRAAFAANLPVGAFFFDGFWADIGTPTSYWQTCKEFLDRVCDPSGAKFAASLGFRSWEASLANQTRQLVTPNKSEQRGGATLFGPTFAFGQNHFAEGVRLGPNAILFGDCVIGKNAVIRNSLLVPGCRIDADANLEDMIAFGDQQIPIGPVIR